MKVLSLCAAVTGLQLIAQSTSAAELPERIESIEHKTAHCFSAPPAVNCEVSAVVRTGESLILANDKPVPDREGTAVFTLAFKDGQLSGLPSYLPGKALKEADKFEALTTTLDGRYVIASTAFNKAGTEQNPRADVLNTLVYWPVNAPQSAKVLSLSSRGGVNSSMTLRKQIGEAVGSPYFQIEGISMAPSEPGMTSRADEQLILGIRKHGNSSADSAFSFLLISAHVKLNDGELRLVDSFKRIKRLELSAAGRVLGLSGIEYDRYNQDRLYAVTSFEQTSVDDKGNKVDEIGGFLWVLPFTEGKPGEPRLVHRADGKALMFSNKPEGVEVLDARHILVVHDDDRVEVQTSEAGIKRGNSEFAYSQISFAPVNP